MKAINRKLWRDLLHMKGQIIAVILVVACGISTYVSMVSVYGSLLATRQAYYDGYRFAHVFTNVKRAPSALVQRVAAIPGVAAVQDRIVMDVTLDVPGLAEPASARLVSVPDHREPMVNDVYLRTGRYIDADHPDQVIASEAFATANGLLPGDTIGAVINGRWKRLTIVGLGLSPEYVYEIQGAASIMPDNRRFGVLWMSHRALASAFDMTGAFNDLALRLAHGARSEEVIDEVDRILEPYGSYGAFDRSRQISASMLNDELRQLQTNGVLIPVIFLAVAAFLLNIVLNRLVGMQRDQVAVLKAFGYSNLAVGGHYLSFALVAILIGAVIGTGFGMWIGSSLTEVYTQYYRFPVLRYVAGPGVIAAAVLISAGAAGAAAIGAVRRAVKLPPAEAMRPEAPQRFHIGWLERVGMQRAMSTSVRMVMRSLERNPWKAALSVIGIAYAVAILVVGQYSFDAITFMVDLQFRTVQREDLMVVFNAPRPARTQHDLMRLDGVVDVEPVRMVPVRVVAGHIERRSVIQGMDPGARLRRVVDEHMHVHEPPVNGLAMTTKLAEAMNLRAGDTVTAEVLEGARPVLRLPVVALVDELLGTALYMDRRSLNRMLDEDGAISGAYLSVDEAYRSALYEQLKRTPAVAGVAVRENVIESFEKTIAESQGIASTMLIVFAGVIAVGVVYNSARIALSERGRELASLRVLGFTRREVAVLLLTEQALLTVAAIPLGWLIGVGICAALVSSYSTEFYRLPLFISTGSFAFSALVVVLSGVFSGILVRRRIYHLDIVEVLKTRE